MAVNSKKCPRCGEGRLQSWAELDDDGREVVKRLPLAQDYPVEQRQQKHLWCPRCWYESTDDTDHFA